MALSAYSSASMADYTVWYDGDIGGPTYQEHQLYNGNTLLIPPAWACGRKFSTPSYYRHLDAYYNTFGSRRFLESIFMCGYRSQGALTLASLSLSILMAAKHFHHQSVPLL